MKQFEVTDYKADVEWDDIIPQDELAKLKEEEKKKAEEDYLNEQIAMYSRRRAAVKQLQGGTPDTSGVDDDEEEEGSGRRAARKKVEENHELSEKEIRGIYRSILRIGDLSGKWNQLVEEGSISNKNPVLIKHAYNEILSISKKLVKEEEARRTEALAELERKAKESKSSTVQTDGENPMALWIAKKKEKKAVLFTYQGVKNINAELVLSRPPDMRLLESLIPKENPLSFELPRTPKLVLNWNCEWSAKDDAMLLVGVNKFGYGSWTQIRDDPLLGLQNKLFLEGTSKANEKPSEKEAKGSNKKVPGAVHIGRRVDYLFFLLRGEEDSTAAGTNGTTKKKTVKKPKAEAKPKKTTKSQSPDVKVKKPKTKKTGSGSNINSPKLDSHPTMKIKTDEDHHDENDDYLEYDSMDERLCKATLKPVAKSLMKLHKGNQGLGKHEWAMLLRKELVSIGEFIDETCKEKKDDKFSKHLWSYASFYWPAKVPSLKITAMYTRIKSQADASKKDASKKESKDEPKKEAEEEPKKEATEKPKETKELHSEKPKEQPQEVKKEATQGEAPKLEEKAQA